MPDGERRVLASQAGGVLTLTLNQPERRNALSRTLMTDLQVALAAIAEGTRVVVLAAAGPVFCAGGDIAEYAAAEPGRERENAEALAGLLTAIRACPVPVVARVHAGAYGGGVGLVAAADIAIATADARFSLSEARLGLMPAAIAPHVLRAMGERDALAHMLLAAPFDAAEALRCGLVQRVVAPDHLDAAVAESVDHLLHGAPGALAAIRHLPRLLAANGDAIAIDLHAARLASAEGQEGVAAFLERRPPAWVTGPSGRD